MARKTSKASQPEAEDHAQKNDKTSEKKPEKVALGDTASMKRLMDDAAAEVCILLSSVGSQLPSTVPHPSPLPPRMHRSYDLQGTRSITRILTPKLHLDFQRE